MIFFIITLAHQTRKVTRAPLSPSKDNLYYDPDSVARSDNEEEDDEKSKLEKAIAATTVRPLKYPSCNEDEDYDEE